MLTLGRKRRRQDKQKAAGKETRRGDAGRRGETDRRGDTDRRADADQRGGAGQSGEVDKVRVGDTEAEEECRESKERTESNRREMTTMEGLGVRWQGTPHWNAPQGD
ncbi:hypothetical protein NDU88_002366 [Pleurodeles waltl]|uniref:Uncharacterized protein n=1 Tax=Pleurodeles waltl TaxID=8319 RepID=A0AAV7P829_PLEWA|nr:hypothetical protein NDU88_002366 [Pleurodeles waltl]